MAQKKWYVSKVRYCEHVGHEIALETEVVLPSAYLLGQPPRIIAPVAQMHWSATE